MKKIGIITLCGNDNYGNKLQNYALLKTVEKMEYEAYTIWDYCPFKNCFAKQTIKNLKNIVIGNMKNDERTKKFKSFTENYLKIYKKKIFYNNDLGKISNEFEKIIVGSDQVWNYNFVNNFNTYFLLKSEKNKNISYAASFGINDIPNEMKEGYKLGLNNIKYISVRENRGKEIVEELTGRKDVEVLVDPTMLLTAKEWDKVAKKPEQLKCKKYILNYFLGELSEKRREEIDRIAKENQCEVINILDKNSPFYQTGPSEFLYLEKNAFLICTDSFHSSVFAILYNRPFIIFDREQKNVASMNSRLETLINKFELKNRKFEDEITKENLEHDYTEAYKILEKEREKSIKFLKNALDIKQ